LNITLRTPEFELAITDAAHEEVLDTLALLINAGVVPTEDVIEVFEDGEEEYCGDTCGYCGDEDGDDEITDEEMEVIEFLEDLEAKLNEVFAEVAEQEAAEAEKKKEEEKKEEVPHELEQLFNLFFAPKK
jgi:hypothetical protein